MQGGVSNSTTLRLKAEVKMSYKRLKDSESRTCQSCDKQAKWEVVYAEHPRTDLYCSADNVKMFCANQTPKEKE